MNLTQRLYIYALISSVLIGLWCLFVFTSIGGAFSHLEYYGIKYGSEAELAIRRTTLNLMIMITLPFTVFIVSSLIGWRYCLKQYKAERKP